MNEQLYETCLQYTYQDSADCSILVYTDRLDSVLDFLYLTYAKDVFLYIEEQKADLNV